MSKLRNVYNKLSRTGVAVESANENFWKFLAALKPEERKLITRYERLRNRRSRLNRRYNILKKRTEIYEEGSDGH